MDIVDSLRAVAGAPSEDIDCVVNHKPRMRHAADEIEHLRNALDHQEAIIECLTAEISEYKEDSERYRHLLSEAYVFGRTTPDIHNIPDEPVSL